MIKPNNADVTNLTNDLAMETLKIQGWNKEGAEAIIDTLISDGIALEDMTIADLIRLSDDYKDR